MVIAEARQTSYGGQRFEDIERLELPKEILLRLARALEDTAPPAAPARGDSSIGQVKPIQHKQSVQEDGAAGPQPAGDAAQSSGHAERSSINDTLLAKFLSIGFTETEIGAVSMMGLCCKRRYNHDEDSFTINLVRIVCGMEPLELNSGSGIKPGSASAAADSESLANEIEALGSIYDGLEVSDTVHLFAVPCKVLLVTLMNDDGPTIIKLIYYNSAEYLTEGSASRVYGWIVESPLAPKLARDVSAYGNLLLQRADAGLGTGFDFVLHVQSGRVENSGTDLIPTAVSAVPKKESGKKDKPAGSREVSVKNAGLPPPDRFPSGVPRKPLELPSIDLLLNLKLPEYRQALMLAMNAGLSGQAAREKARADLEYVLPSSTIAAIREEEVTLDLIRERAFKLSTFGTRGEIICCKVLGKETDLSKPKCKAWLQKAREVFIVYVS